MKKKRSITLIEIMIVILLIGLIGGALAYNMRGSLEKGRAFKTEQHIERLHDILMLEHARTDQALRTIVNNKREIVQRSPLVKNGLSILRDGWGNELTIDIVNDDLRITSEKLRVFKENHG